MRKPDRLHNRYCMDSRSIETINVDLVKYFVYQFEISMKQFNIYLYIHITFLKTFIKVTG